MAKWAGVIGYDLGEIETSPGVYVRQIVEHPYRGELLKNNHSRNGGDQINPGFSISNSISVVGDRFAMDHFHQMVYVSLHHTKWNIQTIDIEYPRLNLSLGGLYNGEE